MADTNYVQIRIRASDTAKPDLDELRANLDELGSKVDTAKIDVNDEDAKRKLLEINAGLAELNKRVANPKIDTASAARAEARIEKLKSDFQDLIDKTNQQSSKGGLLEKLLFGAGGAAASGGDEAGGLLGSLPGGGGPGTIALLGGIGAAAAAALVEVTGLVSGFAAAGTGLGAFALLALPAFDKVKAAIGDTHKQLEKLTPDERGAVLGIRGLTSEFGKMSRAFQPAAFKVFNDALKIANELLPDIKPFADTAAKALDGLLKQVAKFVDSSGFKNWLKQFHSLEGPAIHAIGEGIGHVAVAFGKLMTIMSKKDVINSINIAFSVLAGSLTGLGWAVRITMTAWDHLSAKFKAARQEAHSVAHDFDVMRHDIAAAFDWLVHRVSEDIDHVRTNLSHWASDVGQDVGRVRRFFEQLPGEIMSALASLPGKLFSFGMHLIDMLADGIRERAESALSGAMNYVSGLISDFIPHSPAKKGALSGRGDPRLGGERIAQMLAQGLTDGAGAVDAAAGRLTSGARFGGGHGGGGQGQLQVVLEFHPPAGAAVLGSEFWTAFANGIRIRGGSPAIVTRKVALR